MKASRSQKESVRVPLGMFRLSQGWTLAECREEWRSIYRRTVAELRDYLREVRSA